MNDRVGDGTETVELRWLGCCFALQLPVIELCMKLPGSCELLL
jgi:hypothetical protein